MNAATIGQLILGGFALIAIAAGVIAFFQQQQAKATIDIQGETIKAQEARLDEYRETMADRDLKISALDSRCAAFEAENHLLRELVTGKDALAALTLSLAEHREQITRSHAALRERQDAILAELERLERMR